MNDDLRRKILARRNQFVAAALAASSAAVLPACDTQAQVCLEPMWECDEHTLVAHAPDEVCVGDRFAVRASRGCDGGGLPEDVTAGVVFATSDPELLVIEGSMALARGEGVVELTAIIDGLTATKKVHVLACADVGADAGDASSPDASPSADAGDTSSDDADDASSD